MSASVNINHHSLSSQYLSSWSRRPVHTFNQFSFVHPSFQPPVHLPVNLSKLIKANYSFTQLSYPVQASRLVHLSVAPIRCSTIFFVSSKMSLHQIFDFNDLVLTRDACPGAPADRRCRRRKTLPRPFQRSWLLPAGRLHQCLCSRLLDNAQGIHL